MKYAAYPAKDGKARVRLVILPGEVDRLNLDNVEDLNVAFDINDKLTFRPKGVIRRGRDEGSSRLYWGTVGLQLPPCGSREVQPEALANGYPGFSIPRTAGPIHKRMPIRRNGKNYTMQDLKTAVALVNEVARALDVELTFVNGEFLIKI